MSPARPDEVLRATGAAAVLLAVLAAVVLGVRHWQARLDAEHLRRARIHALEAERSRLRALRERTRMYAPPSPASSAEGARQRRSLRHVASDMGPSARARRPHGDGARPQPQPQPQVLLEEPMSFIDALSRGAVAPCASAYDESSASGSGSGSGSGSDGESECLRGDMLFPLLGSPSLGARVPSGSAGAGGAGGGPMATGFFGQFRRQHTAPLSDPCCASDCHSTPSTAACSAVPSSCSDGTGVLRGSSRGGGTWSLSGVSCFSSGSQAAATGVGATPGGVLAELPRIENGRLVFETSRVLGSVPPGTVDTTRQVLAAFNYDYSALHRRESSHLHSGW
ncbi:hypothetical protein HYH03_004303 [Edaphochlamys debaryana]|uniref:Uncharacterized protein n=1 Tax=Edaphochlamys debaryana TaxID=47281 RepID=A0A835YB33_9CHLO|nr:hypothetical protein HYH03_004303 [Edaphochlamys debaryana]|eukprot:KAG2497556.1 hypothetical protein HYH03_004303 [Edaphochlamys debaryana]